MQFWQRIKSLGTDGLEPTLRRKVELTNEIAVLSIAICGLGLTINYSVENWRGLAIVGTGTFLYSMCLFLNSVGWFRTGRDFLLLTANLQILVISLFLYGRDAGMQYCCGAVGISGILLYESDERIAKGLNLLASAAAFSMVQYFDWNIVPIQPLTGMTANLTEFGYIMGSCSIIAITLHLYQKAVARAENSLVERNEELKISTDNELRRSNDLLVHSEKLSQLGELIASIGHEIANPISLVVMASEDEREVLNELESKLLPLFAGSPEADQIGAAFKVILEDLRSSNDATTTAATRLKELSMALRTQSRQENLPVAGIDLNEVVKESMVLVGGRTKFHDLDECLADLPSITGYRSRIGQVVTNLLANAADAIAEKIQEANRSGGERFKGTIAIKSQSVERDGMPGVLVAISDNGDGVPKDLQKKIFDQFFTTKPAGVGTGLGLSMCVDIVKDHGGVLSVDRDEALGGARFELWLPVAGGAEARA